MYKLYTITNQITRNQYFGITKMSLKHRWNMHRFTSKNGRSKLACALRSYGVENFKMELVQEFDTQEECCKAEQEAIATHNNLYNLAVGGQVGFSMRLKSEDEQQAWKDRLSLARQGKQPALGMQHTEENKKFFSECGKLRWDKYGRYSPEDILELRCCDAIRKFGISKTHYYRLRNMYNEHV